MDHTVVATRQKTQVAEFRDIFLDELPVLAAQYIDVARAEGTTAAYEKVMNTALKVIEGLEVAKKADPYANLPTINFHIGADMAVTATIEAAKPDVVDVEAKRVDPEWPFPRDNPLPDNPLELLHETVQAEPIRQEKPSAALRQEGAADEGREEETLRALDLAASAMALD